MSHFFFLEVAVGMVLDSAACHRHLCCLRGFIDYLYWFSLPSYSPSKGSDSHWPHQPESTDNLRKFCVFPMPLQGNLPSLPITPLSGDLGHHWREEFGFSCSRLTLRIYSDWGGIIQRMARALPLESEVDLRQLCYLAL